MRAGGRRVNNGASASAVEEIVTQVLQLDVVLVDCLVSGLVRVESNDHIRGKLNQRNTLIGFLQDQKVLRALIAPTLCQTDHNGIVVGLVAASLRRYGYVSFQAHHHQSNVAVRSMNRRYVFGSVNSFL